MISPILNLTEKTEKRLTNKSISNTSSNETLQKIYKKLNTEESVNIVKTILTEYFNNYMLIGYDIAGDRVVIHHAKNNKDEDAVIELLRYVLMHTE